jgi:hypothetical protein
MVLRLIAGKLAYLENQPVEVSIADGALANAMTICWACIGLDIIALQERATSTLIGGYDACKSHQLILRESLNERYLEPSPCFVDYFFLKLEVLLHTFY